jgi:hypothetical protein
MTAGMVELNREQLHAFIHDRLDGAGPCRVQENAPLAALALTSVVPNARLFLAALEGGEAKLTQKGYLNRKFVSLLMDRLHWQDCDPADIRAICKVVNEMDFIPAMYLHAVCKLAGLARHHRGFLKLTHEGRSLLPEEQAGRLQALLFRTTFAKYNPAYLDGFNMPDVFTPQISLILYLIGQFCTDWREPGPLMRSVTLPAKEITEPQYPNLPELTFETRVLRYLAWFGLLEKARPAANDDWRQPRLYRKTELFDRMLRFEVRR